MMRSLRQLSYVLRLHPGRSPNGVRHLQTPRLPRLSERHLDAVAAQDYRLRRLCIIKDIMRAYPNSAVPYSVLRSRRVEFGMHLPVHIFLDKYISIFLKFNGPRYNTVPWYRLTEQALAVDEEETKTHQEVAQDTANRLCKLLMMSRTRFLSLRAIEGVKWDLGLPRDYARTLIPLYPDLFTIVNIPRKKAYSRYGMELDMTRTFRKGKKNMTILQGIDSSKYERYGVKLLKWDDELAMSSLQMRGDAKAALTRKTSFEKVPINYDMYFPYGHGATSKVREWQKNWDNIPYFSPYDVPDDLDVDGDVMEKMIVGLFHEILSLTLTKQLRRGIVARLSHEMGYGRCYKSLLQRYPGIFYLRTTAYSRFVMLKESFKNPTMVMNHPLLDVRQKYYELMAADSESDRLEKIRKYGCRVPAEVAKE